MSEDSYFVWLISEQRDEVIDNGMGFGVFRN